MQIAQDEQQLALTDESIFEIERYMDYEGIENYFTMEANLLNHLLHLEVDEAQQTVRRVIDYMRTRVASKKLDAVKYYLVTLSSLMARHLNSSFYAPHKAFAFNIACFNLIDSKLNEKNAAEIADELIELYRHVLQDKKRPMLTHDTVNKVILYINEKVKSPLTVEEIAKKFNVSTSHLSRIFREHTGSTLVEYINIRKVEESQYYLRFSDKKIADIADQFYFCNQSYFTRIFKKYTGQTPRGFRSGTTRDYFHFAFPEDSKQSADGQSL